MSQESAQSARWLGPHHPNGLLCTHGCVTPEETQKGALSRDGMGACPKGNAHRTPKHTVAYFQGARQHRMQTRRTEGHRK